jgi:hypothetical protein
VLGSSSQPWEFWSTFLLCQPSSNIEKRMAEQPLLQNTWLTIIKQEGGAPFHMQTVSDINEIQPLLQITYVLQENCHLF